MLDIVTCGIPAPGTPEEPVPLLALIGCWGISTICLCEKMGVAMVAEPKIDITFANIWVNLRLIYTLSIKNHFKRNDTYRNSLSSEQPQLLWPLQRQGFLFG